MLLHNRLIYIYIFCYPLSELLYDFPNFSELSSLVSFMRAYDESAQTHFTLVKPSQEVWNEAKLKSFKKRLSPDHHKQGKFT